MTAGMSSGTAVVSLPTDTQILITREFDAPRHLVYRAWTTPELITRWWTAGRGEVISVEVDLRVGGRWRYAMMAHHGFEVAFFGVDREIVPNERLVSTEIYEAVPEHEGLNTLTLSERGGRTTLSLLLDHDSVQSRDARLESGMEPGLQDGRAEPARTGGAVAAPTGNPAAPDLLGPVAQPVGPTRYRRYWYMATDAEDTPIGPIDSSVVPRYAGLATFARLPRREDVPRFDVAVLGVPFDSGVSYRPGARFGPAHIRQSSRLLRPYNPALEVSPFGAQQVVDAGDLAVNPFDIGQAIATIEAGARELSAGGKLLVLGGDHTIALPVLRAMHARHGPIAVLHFDAHLDTWDSYFGEPYTHGTPFRRASEEGLLDREHCLHIGIRGPLYAPADLTDSFDLGFATIGCVELETLGVAGTIERMRARLGDRPIYVSVDIDVLDPAHAPGTGTPEAGGMSSRELLAVLRGLMGAQVVSADIVEVSPAYDHAEITGIAAAHVGYELLSVLALG